MYYLNPINNIETDKVGQKWYKLGGKVSLNQYQNKVFNVSESA